jgi:hypothetical protein
MLSTKNNVRLFLSLVLIAVCTAGSEELQIAVGTLFSWATGHILLHHFALPAGFRHAHLTYIIVSCWLLAAYNDLFWENTCGRFLDLYFDRWHQDISGSGFTAWYVTYRRRHAYEVEFFWRFLRATVGWSFAALSLPFLVPLAHWWSTPSWQSQFERRCRELGELELEARSTPLPLKREMRYFPRHEGHVVVPQFGSVVAGDYDYEGAAVWRRHQLTRQFA